MFRALNLFFKVDIYNEHAFFVKKVDDLNFIVRSKNGLKAVVCFSNRVMFVKLFDSHEMLIGQYCTPMKNSDTCPDDFLIQESQKTIFFYLSKDSIPSFQFFSYVFFCNQQKQIKHRPSRSQEINMIYMLSGGPDSEAFFRKLDDVQYHVMQFSKKKIINGVYRFKYSKSDTQYSHYMVDNIVIEISNFNDYIVSVTNLTDWTYYQHDDLKPAVDRLCKRINLLKVPLLKIEGEFCSIKKEKGLLKFQYTQYRHRNINSSIILNSRSFKENDDSILIDMTYNIKTGHVKIKETQLNADLLTLHRINILKTLDVSFNRLCLVNPSDNVIESLAELELPHKIPLQEENLAILDMYQV